MNIKINSKKIAVTTLRVFILILCLSAKNLTVSAQSTNEEIAIKQLPSSIVALRSGGYWEKQEKHGIYRVVVNNNGWEHVSSQVAVQWIDDGNPEIGDQGAISTVPVKEINDSNTWSVDISSMKYVKGKMMVTIDAVNTYSPKEQKQFRFTLLEPGKYQSNNRP